VTGDWRDQALCAETDPEAFFPEKGGTTRPAKEVCFACYVRAECLAYALAHPELQHGVWGGLSWPQRRKLLREAA
jgi:WhiB family transcriptional regulator, redox-sensing transcriptional regulator